MTECWTLQSGIWHKVERRRLISANWRSLPSETGCGKAKAPPWCNSVSGTFLCAFREQYHTDPQGRSVRTFHAATRPSSAGKQGVFWADMRDAPPEHMELAFFQRRNLIVGECLQLKKDVDSYNDNNASGILIQMIFDFSEDIAEREQPTRYGPIPR